jgi:peptidoglycan endopeptidase LytF
LRLDRVRPIIAFCLLAALAGAACSGGGSSNGNAPDSSRIPTATLPAKLPDPKILGNTAASAGGGSSYVIKDGDTLAGIASRLGITLDDLRAANPGVDPGTLRVGQSIKLPANPDLTPPAAVTATAPDGNATARAATATPAPQPTEPPPTEAPASPTAPAPGTTATPASAGQTYTVQDGDFPAKIAEKFGITVEELLAANPGIDPTHMHIGDVIIIPPKRP